MAMAQPLTDLRGSHAPSLSTPRYEYTDHDVALMLLCSGVMNLTPWGSLLPVQQVRSKLTQAISLYQ